MIFSSITYIFSLRPRVQEVIGASVGDHYANVRHTAPVTSAAVEDVAPHSTEGTGGVGRALGVVERHGIEDGQLWLGMSHE